VQGRIYVTGGFGDDRVVLATVTVYDPGVNSWSPAPPMPAPRHHHGAVELDGKLYVIGGYSTLGAVWAVESSVFEFDPATNVWTVRASLPAPRGAMAAAAVGGRIYVFGGAAFNQEWSSTYIYDPAGDVWSIGEPMPTAREHVAAAAIGGVIYVAGGRTFSGTNNGRLESYDTQTAVWASLPPMATPRSGHGVAAVGGRLYVFGGENLANQSVLASVEEYHPAGGGWRAMAPLPHPVTGPGTAAAGGVVHVIGGSNASGDTQPVNRTFRPE
jgi:N-acetylneuraminic acid mutarotase